MTQLTPQEDALPKSPINQPTDYKTQMAEEEKTTDYSKLLALNEVHLVPNRDKFECPACFLNVEVGEGATLQDCLHSFCKLCLVSAVQFSETTIVKCPFQNEEYSCESHLQEREIKALVTPEIYDRHLQKSIDLAESQSQNSFHCRTPGCCGWCFFEDNVNIFLCPVCNHSNCLTCAAIHEGKNCRQYQDEAAPSNEEGEKTKQNKTQLMEQEDSVLKTSANHETPEDEDGRTYYSKLLALNHAHLVPNSDIFECPICFLNVGIGEGVVLQDCLHSFCKLCLASAVQFSETVLVKCPFQNEDYSCESHLQEREIKSLVTPEIYDRHLQKSVDLAENQSQNSFHCQTPDCRGWCFYENYDDIFLCPVCNHNNCLACAAIHEGKTCQQYQEEASFMGNGGKKTKEYLQNIVNKGEAMRCPQCHVFITKISGCDSLICLMCRAHIIWAPKRRQEAKSSYFPFSSTLSSLSVDYTGIQASRTYPNLPSTSSISNLSVDYKGIQTSRTYPNLPSTSTISSLSVDYRGILTSSSSSLFYDSTMPAVNERKRKSFAVPDLSYDFTMPSSVPVANNKKQKSIAVPEVITVFRTELMSQEDQLPKTQITQPTNHRTQQAEDKKKTDYSNLLASNAVHLMPNRDKFNAVHLIPNRDKFKCPGCFLNIEAGEGAILQNCLHSFCKLCLASAVQFSATAAVKCPFQSKNYSCESHLQEIEIKSLVTPEIYDRHLQKNINVPKNQSQNSFHCQTPYCPGLCVYENKNDIFLCPVCNHFNCLNCNAVHEGKSCQQYQHQLALKCKTDELIKHLQVLNNSTRYVPRSVTSMPGASCEVTSMPSISHNVISMPSFSHNVIPASSYSPKVISMPSVSRNVTSVPSVSRNVTFEPSISHNMSMPSASCRVTSGPSISSNVMSMPSVSHKLTSEPSIFPNLMPMPSISHNVMSMPSASHKVPSGPSISSNVMYMPSVSHKPTSEPSIFPNLMPVPSISHNVISSGPSTSSSVMSMPSVSPKVTSEPSTSSSVMSMPSVSPKMTSEPSTSSSVMSMPSVSPKVTSEPSTSNVMSMPSVSYNVSSMAHVSPNVMSMPSASHNEVSMPRNSLKIQDFMELYGITKSMPQYQNSVQEAKSYSSKRNMSMAGLLDTTMPPKRNAKALPELNSYSELLLNFKEQKKQKSIEDLNFEAWFNDIEEKYKQL